MKKLLKIDTSTRGNDSHSRGLANMITQKHMQKYPNTEIVYRDLSTTHIPHLTQEFINAIYTPQEERNVQMNETLSLSEELINELREADSIILSLPMYNFGIPSLLKAYIDHVTRVGETFSMDENGFIGLITGKKLTIIAAYGADFTQMKDMDFVKPYLMSLFGFLGFKEIEYLGLEGTTMFSSEEIQEKKEKLVNTLTV